MPGLILLSICFFAILHTLGYKVRYVRNITDVGHLEDEVEGAGEDRITKKARLEQLEPMEVVQKYMNTFHDNMNELNVFLQVLNHVLQVILLNNRK